MNDKVEAPKQRVSDGEFRHYVFGLSELRAETERFLKRAGYDLKPSKFIGLVEPDFRAKRKVGDSTLELAGMVRENMDQALEALTKLAAIKAANKDVECVLVLPPINEYVLIEWLTEAKGTVVLRNKRLQAHDMVLQSGQPYRDMRCWLGRRPGDGEALLHEPDEL